LQKPEKVKMHIHERTTMIAYIEGEAIPNY